MNQSSDQLLTQPWPRAVVAAACLLAASCGTTPMRSSADGDALRVRVEEVLAISGLGADALSIIDNIVRHETTAPPFAPPIVRELFADPLAAADAAAFFERSVPGALQQLVEEISTPLTRNDGPPILILDLLEPYLAELAAAQHRLRSAVKDGAIDPAPILRKLEGVLPLTAEMDPVARAVDPAAIERANNLFLAATARFIRVLRATAGRIEFPDRPLRFDSPVGVVSIGTAGDDRHGPDAAVIVDPGGNDVYERAPATGGAISIIVDLAGDDHYIGSDLAMLGFSAIVDFSGNDRYEMQGPGLGAAIAGASILIDFAGDDTYEAGVFGEGAAAFGIGALVDLRGNDTYRIASGGQGLGMIGGIGLLWDRAGNDAYFARGFPDLYDRGGGISMAQGAGLGHRTRYGGGIGILRDDGGDDRYEAEMFAQGVGYFYGAGLLWDRGGDDRYRAVRYAQGNGVHEAVGILRDDSGDDRYTLSFGVGQGMGLDLSVGMLFDGAGDDQYESRILAQGAATANGLGILIDAGGADRWSMAAGGKGWGEAERLRGLPSLGILLYDPARAVFEREGKTVAAPSETAALHGSAADAPVAQEVMAAPRCPASAASSQGDGPPLDEALRKLEGGFIEGTADPGLFAGVRRQLAAQLRASIATLSPNDFDVVHSLGEALRCTLFVADAGEAQTLWNEIERALAQEPATPYAGTFVFALRARPAQAAQMERILDLLDAHPRCGLRASALSLLSTGAMTAAARVQTALRSSCWRLQAQALAVLKSLGRAPQDVTSLPSFLRSTR